MNHRTDNRGQGLLETIIALGIILAGTVGTISLLIATMNAGRRSSNTAIATNLARESIEVVRNIRDSNWLKIEANVDQDSSTAGIQLIGTFDGLFDDSNYHHVRFPVFYRYNHASEFYEVISKPSNNTWVLADVDDFKSYEGSITGYTDTAYSGTITYEGSDSQCSYPDPADLSANGYVTYPCATVFWNDDTYWPSYEYRGAGYGYFNQLPEYTRPLIGIWYSRYDGTDPPETTVSRFRRWLTLNPICRKDEDGDGFADIAPEDSESERIVMTDNGMSDSTCDTTDEVMVGLQVISTVSWGAECPGKDCVQLEDRLYNWRFVQ